VNISRKCEGGREPEKGEEAERKHFEAGWRRCYHLNTGGATPEDAKPALSR